VQEEEEEEEEEEKMERDDLNLLLYGTFSLFLRL
jgi:hypothetical protein